jgi:Fe-S-cluster containining protein
MGAIHLIDGTKGQRLPLKPTHGKPCNGCGYCCAASPCGVAREYIPEHPEDGPCLALEHEAGRFVCGMIRRPSHYMALPNDWADKILGEIIANALGAGKGCDASDIEAPELEQE